MADRDMGFFGFADAFYPGLEFPDLSEMGGLFHEVALHQSALVLPVVLLCVRHPLLCLCYGFLQLPHFLLELPESSP